MTKIKEPEPFIDYKTANVMTRMYDFIIHANNTKEYVYNEIERVITTLKYLQREFIPREDPNSWADALQYDHIPDSIANIRHDAWAAGLTDTLFKKLKDKEFRDRFTGWLGAPVTQDEIIDIYEDDEGETA